MAISKERHDSEFKWLEVQHRENIIVIKSEASAELARTIGRLESQLLQEQTVHTAKIEGYEKRMQTISSQREQEKLATERHLTDEKTRMEQALQEQKDQMTTELEDKKWAMEEDLRLAKDEFETQLKSTKAELDQERDGKANEIQTIKDFYDAEKTRMEQALQEQKNQMTTELEDKKWAMEEDLRLAKDEFEIQLKSTKAELDQERDGKANEIQTIKDSHDTEKSRMREAFEVEKAGLVRGLKETVESLKGALVERDHFKAMSDHELANRFQVISFEVDDFARVVWEKGRESSWPFPGQSFRKSGNERRTKQYIMQNTLWVILYERIFCTPFRVLGSEGKSLETKWIKTFGQGSLLYKILVRWLTRTRSKIYETDGSLSTGD